MTAALDTIRAEHRSLARVLKCLESVVRDLEDPAEGETLELLNAIVFYIRSFPDRFHHPKEDQFLFPAMARADPATADIIAQLRTEHAAGEDLIDALNEAIHQFHDAKNHAAGAVRQAAETYVAFQFDHMRREEEELLPRAASALSSDAWKEIEIGFAGNRDPLAQRDIEKGYKALAAWIQQHTR